MDYPRRTAIDHLTFALGLTLCACGDAGGASSTGTTGGATSTSDTTTSDTTTSDPTGSTVPTTGTPSTTADTDPPATTTGPTTAEPGTTSTTDGDPSTGTTADPGSTGDTDTGGVAPAEFVTYLGGTVFEHGRDVAYDAAGNLYVAGGTASPEFPHTLGGPVGNVDIFVAKYDPTGVLLWAHRLGGPNYDRAYALEVDPAGGVVVAGRAGPELPTTAGVVQPAFAGDMDAANLYGVQDGFVLRMDADGALAWLTYFGGPGRDFIRDIAVDPDGDLYVAASQVTRDHPHVSPGGFDSARAAMDCVAAKLAGDGAAVVWAGYLGGAGDDCPEPSIRVDAMKAPVMVIATGAADLPDTPGAFQAAPAGNDDLFVARIAPAGDKLAFATYFGGSGGEGLETHNLALGPDGRVYLGGGTTSSDLPTTPGALQPAYGGLGGPNQGQNTNYPGDGFIAVLAADGGALDHCTYLGGPAGDAVEGLAVAADGRVFASGGSFSPEFVTTADAFQSAHAGELDGFLAILAPDLGERVYVSFIGGGKWDVLRAVAIGPAGQIAGTGETRSPDLPVTAGAADASFGGGNDFDIVVAQLLP